MGAYNLHIHKFSQTEIAPSVCFSTSGKLPAFPLCSKNSIFMFCLAINYFMPIHYTLGIMFRYSQTLLGASLFDPSKTVSIMNYLLNAS